jgi:hypothetical protein
MVYLPAQKLAIAVSVTMGQKAPEEGNLSTPIAREIAAFLAPEHPME